MKSLQIFAITTIFLSGFFTTNAFSKPKQIYKPYHNSEDVTDIQPRLYQLNSVNVSLSSRLNKPDYLSQEKVIELYKTKIEESLKAKKMLATEQTPQPILINLDIKQKRIFAGEALGNKLSGNYAHSEFEYSSALTDQNKPLAQYKSEKFIGIGKNGNLGKIVRDLSGQGSPQNEIDDISAFSEKIVNNLPK